MRKHGTNRPSPAAIAAISALLVASVGGTALAGKGGTPTGSSSNNGNAVWLVDWDQQDCVDNAAINTSDNYITDDLNDTGNDYNYYSIDEQYVWVKSNLVGASGNKVLPDSWRIEDKGKVLQEGGPLYFVLSCGIYDLMRYYWTDGVGTGSFTFKALKGSDPFAGDSARFD